MRYAHLHTLTNYTFLTGASHPEEYIYQAHERGYDAIAINCIPFDRLNLLPTIS